MNKMKHIFYVFMLSALFFCGECFAEDSWTVNTMTYGVSGPPAVAVDINNNPVAVFTETYPSSILYTAYQTDTGYQVKQDMNIPNASSPKIAITSNNELAVSFLKSGQLWYGSKSSWFDWVFSQVQASVAVADMALTTNDIPHIVYDYQKYIYHAFYDVHSQQWVKEQLSGFGNHSPSTVSIDIASDGKIMISCSENGNIRTAVYSDGFWNYLPLLSGGYYRADAAFTSDGLPAVAFEAPSQIVYAVYINDIIGWVETPVTTYVSRAFCSLAESSTGIPAIAYIDGDKLMYATNVAGGWTTVQIDEKSGYPDLIFDRNNKPLISYVGFDDCLGVPVIKLAGIGLEGFNIADLNNDKIVNFSDFAILAEHWMTTLPGPDITIGDFDQNAKIDASDLKWLSCYWLNYAGH
jgi:hypothetical protein